MNNCCNPFETPAWVSDMIQSVINQKIICNEIQAGLLDCEGQVLAPGTHMVRCEELNALIDDAIKNGEINIPGIESLTFDGERITLVDQAGATHQIDVSELAPQSMSSNGFSITLTMKNGKEYTVNLESAVEEAIIRKTITDAVLTKDNLLEISMGDGSKIKAYLGTLLGEARVRSGSVDYEGDIQIVLGDGATVSIDAKRLREVIVARDSALIGNGDDVPLDIDFSRVCWQVIESITMDDKGLHIKIDNQCEAITLPMKDIAAALKDKVAVCVANTGFITGNGTSGSCLNLDLQKVIDALVKDEKVLGTLVNNLHYKVKVKTDGTLSGDGTGTLPLGVKLSTDAGNLLTTRENGLYYGQQAAADVSVLYVDSVGGSDANKGTRSAPLATLPKAISMVRADQGNIIRLRCGGEYLWPSIDVSTGATRVIEAYGDAYIDGSKVGKPSPKQRTYLWWVRKNVVRPKIIYQVNYNQGIKAYSIRTGAPVGGGTLLLRGLEFTGTAINEPGAPAGPVDFIPAEWVRHNTYGIYGRSTGYTIYEGCVFNSVPKPIEAMVEPEDGWPIEDGKPVIPKESWWGIIGKDSQQEGSQVSFVTCCFRNILDQPKADWYPNIVDVSSGSAQISIGTKRDNWVEEIGYEILPSNMGTALTSPNVLSGVSRDSNGTPRNVTANIIL